MFSPLSTPVNPPIYFDGNRKELVWESLHDEPLSPEKKQEIIGDVKNVLKDALAQYVVYKESNIYNYLIQTHQRGELQRQALLGLLEEQLENPMNKKRNFRLILLTLLKSLASHADLVIPVALKKIILRELPPLVNETQLIKSSLKSLKEESECKEEHLTYLEEMAENTWIGHEYEKRKIDLKILIKNFLRSTGFSVETKNRLEVITVALK